jgi:hypothetical protein
MTTKKTLRVPLAADGIPITVRPDSVDKTGEHPLCEEDSPPEKPRGKTPPQAAPQEIVDGEVTVPVQSSIESTLRHELLRRQSKEADVDEE